MVNAQNKPNILIIVVDSLRADHLSCYGYHRETTPNIDRIAAEGCVFETAITAAPFSPASYASLFSNLYPHQHGVNGDTVRVWPDHFTRLAEKMKANGYFTFGVSNNDFVSTRCNSAQGFDEYVDLWQPAWCVRQYQRGLCKVRKYLGETAARRLESNRLRCAAKGNSAKSMRTVRELIERGCRPFFGFVVLMDPHIPYDRRRRRFLRTLKDAERFFRRDNHGKLWARLMARREMLSPEQLAVVIDCYDSEIHYADHWVGQLCDWLRSRGELDDTVLVVTSDHGEAFGEHGVWGHGFCLNDCLTRVPLVVRCPRYWRAGLRSNALVQLHDVHDLCISVAATGEPTPHDHPYCLTQASDPQWTGRDVVFSEFPVQNDTLALFRSVNNRFAPRNWAQAMWSVRSRDWRYVEYEGGEYELYDLVNDPCEEHSVHGRHPDICKELALCLGVHREDAIYEPVEPVADTGEGDEVVLERLRGLGYIE